MSDAAGEAMGNAVQMAFDREIGRIMGSVIDHPISSDQEFRMMDFLSMISLSAVAGFLEVCHANEIQSLSERVDGDIESHPS